MVNCADLKQIYQAVIHIDYQSGKIIDTYASEPFEALNNMSSIEALEDYFTTLFSDNIIPICQPIEINHQQYWISRKKVDQSLFYLIESRPYVDTALEQATRKSIIDGLTECFNKVETTFQLEQFLLRFLRYKNAFSVIMFDIDFFKKINDTYGHLAGDFVLSELAKLTKSVLRESDICGRFGGEEFLIILPETRVAGAMKLANRLNQACEAHNFVYKNTKIPVHISAGITAPTQTDSVHTLIERCDEALYDAKKNGRNRVEYR